MLRLNLKININKMNLGKIFMINVHSFEIILNIKIISTMTLIHDLTQIFFLTIISNFGFYPFLYLFLLVLLSN